MRISRAFVEGEEVEEGSRVGEEHRLTLAGRRLQMWGKHRVGRDVQRAQRETGASRGKGGKVQQHLLEVTVICRPHLGVQLCGAHGSPI